MATEIATAFVSLVPSFKGGSAAITRELGGAVKPASDKAGEQLGGGLRNGIKGAAGAIGGALLGALALDKIVDVFGQALEQGAQTAKLGAQLGLSASQTAKAGKITGEIYANNFGDSLEQVNEAAALVSRNIGLSFNSTDFQPVTEKVLNLATTFDQDLGGTTAAVGQLMKTGLAKNATEALDLLTRGFQSGVNKADDLLDTVTEYSTQFRKLGVSGPQALSLMNQGLQAGARDADVVADAIKEFSIRAVDGSDTTALGFKQIGLNAKTMAKAIGQGGKSANDALDLTLDRLRAIPDPVKRAQAAYNLFGTQSEDLGAALFALDPSKATTAMKDTAGAADRMGKVLGGTPQAALDTFKRQLSQGLVNAAGTAIGYFLRLGDTLGPKLTPILNSVGALFGQLGPPLKAFGATILPVLQSLGDKLLGVLGPGLKAIGDIFANDVIPAIKGFLPVIAPVAAFLINVLGGAVIGALKGVINIIKGVLQVFSGVLTFLTGVFTGDWSKAWKGIQKIGEGVWNIIKGAWQVFLNVGLGKAFKLVGGLLGKIASGLWKKVAGLFKSGMSSAGSSVSSGIAAIGRFFASLPGKAYNAAKSLGSRLLTLATSAMKSMGTGITKGITKLLGFLRGIPGKAVSAVGNLGRVLLGAGRKLIQGLIDGVQQMLGSLRRKLSEVTNLMPDWKGPPRKDAQLLRPNGRLIMGGLITGIQDQTPQLRSTLQGITTSIPGQFGTRIGADSPELAAPEVRVFIGDQELKAMVRTEVSETNRATRSRVVTGSGRF